MCVILKSSIVTVPPPNKLIYIPIEPNKNIAFIVGEKKGD